MIAMAKKIIAGSAKASRRKSRKKASAIQARRKKEFLYRGFTLEELQAMPFDEVLGLLPSRARRTYLRGLNYEQQLLFDKLKDATEPVRTHRRLLPRRVRSHQEGTPALRTRSRCNQVLEVHAAQVRCKTWFQDILQLLTPTPPQRHLERRCPSPPSSPARSPE